MNQLSTADRTRVLACLVEGNSQRATAMPYSPIVRQHQHQHHQNMSTKQIAMHGQEKWTNGNELRWVIGTDENGPARVENQRGEVIYTGTYKNAVAWLEKRGNSPVGQ